jgi:hypothetical protein
MYAITNTAAKTEGRAVPWNKGKSWVGSLKDVATLIEVLRETGRRLAQPTAVEVDKLK